MKDNGIEWECEGTVTRGNHEYGSGGEVRDYYRAVVVCILLLLLLWKKK
jgi:hypothetical protein